MPKPNRLTTFAEKKHGKTFLLTLSVTAGVGGAALFVSPDQPVATTPEPVLATKDSGPQDIVRAIVSQGQAAGLTAEQIKTIIATAKIESSFRPAASGGVQPYGGPGTAADEVLGLFQEKASFGTVAERQDPNQAIARFIVRYREAFTKYGITGDTVQAATLAQNPQLLKHGRGVGTGYYNTVEAAMGEAGALYNQAAAPQVQLVVR